MIPILEFNKIFLPFAMLPFSDIVLINEQHMIISSLTGWQYIIADMSIFEEYNMHRRGVCVWNQELSQQLYHVKAQQNKMENKIYLT